MTDIKVLVAEDSPTMRRIIVTQLNQLGYVQVEEAENGKEALDALTGGGFGFMLTDWNMPLMDGRTLVENVRKTEDLKDLPILMVTTRNSKADVVAALKAGVNNFVVKPFKPSELGKKIDAVLAALGKAA